MRKGLFILSIVGLMTITSCGPTSNTSKTSIPSSEDSSSTSSTTTSQVTYEDQLKLREDGFNALVMLSTTAAGEDTIKSDYKTYVSNDYYTFEKYESNSSLMPYSTLCLVNNNGKVFVRELSPNNEIVETDFKTNYDMSFFGYNNIKDFNIVIDQIGEYDVINNVDSVVHFNNLLTSNLTGTLKPKQAKFLFDGTTLSYSSFYENNGVTLTMDVDFIDKKDEVVKKIEVLNDNPENNLIQDKITVLKNNNYTVEVKEVEGKVLKTIFVNNNQLYIREAFNNLGYVKVENGYDEVSVNDEETSVVLNSSSQNSYESLLAKFNISKDVFYKNNDDFITYPYVKDLNEQFNTVGLDNYLFDNIILNVHSDSLVLKTSSVMNKKYEITFKDINNTVIPVNLTDYGTKSSWSDENIEIDNAIQTMIGDISKLPYMDTGYGWNYYDLTEGEYLEIISENVPENETQTLKAQYASLLKEKGYRKMNESETENLGWVNAVGEDQEVYDLGNGFAVEVYDGYVDSFVAGLGLYIQPII